VRSRYGRLSRVVLALSDDPHSTAAWAYGANGERALGKLLDPLRDEGLAVLHDRRIPRSKANIDHLVVAPWGVFVVDAKNYKGRVETRNRGGFFSTDLRLYVVGRDKTALVAGMTKQAQAVRAALDDDDASLQICKTNLFRRRRLVTVRAADRDGRRARALATRARQTDPHRRTALARRDRANRTQTRPRTSRSLIQSRSSSGAAGGASSSRPAPCGGDVRAELGDDIGQPALEGVELAARHLSEERTRERSVVALELGRKPLPFCGESHERRSPVGRVRLPRHEAAPNERIHEPGDRPRRHLERVGKDTLGHGSALTQFPKQMRARRREAKRLDCQRHVVVQQNDELEHPIERIFVLLYLLYSEV
jgi:hypothetical protein